MSAFEIPESARAGLEARELEARPTVERPPSLLDALDSVCFQSPDYAPHPEESECVFGGFSCGYWLIADGCLYPHWELHLVGADGTCPCGNTFPGAANCRVEFDANEAPG